MTWNFPIWNLLKRLRPNKTWSVYSTIEGIPPNGYRTNTIKFTRGGEAETPNPFKLTITDPLEVKRTIQYINKTTGDITRTDEDIIQMENGSTLNYEPGMYTEYSYYQEYVYSIIG